MRINRRELLRGIGSTVGAGFAQRLVQAKCNGNLSPFATAKRTMDAPPGLSVPGRLPAFPNHALPGLRKLVEMPLRDSSVCHGPDGLWYLTGTIPPFWDYNEGIKVWKSTDMVNWESLGMVFRYGASPWHKKYLDAKKPLWAPEIHYMKGTFWLTYSMPGWDGTGKTSGCGLLRSRSGKAEGPYEDMHPADRLGDEIDASLFEDDDGSVHFLWHSGKIARMKDDMSGLAEAYRWIRTPDSDEDPQHHDHMCQPIFGKDFYDHIGFEGAYLIKANGYYYFSCAETWNGRYSCCTARAEKIYGPYSDRYESIPHGGHNVFFKDELGAWWSTYFGGDADGESSCEPWKEQPGVLPIRFDERGRICLA